MSEQLQATETPEQRVFGDAYSLVKGEAAQIDVVNRVAMDRWGIVDEGGQAWIFRALDSDRGVAADLWKNRVPVVLLDHDFETGLTDVYSRVHDVEKGGKLMHWQVPFDEAVLAAEALAAEYE